MVSRSCVCPSVYYYFLIYCCFGPVTVPTGGAISNSGHWSGQHGYPIQGVRQVRGVASTRKLILSLRMTFVVCLEKPSTVRVHGRVPMAVMVPVTTHDACSFTTSPRRLTPVHTELKLDTRTVQQIHGVRHCTLPAIRCPNLGLQRRRNSSLTRRLCTVP